MKITDQFISLPPHLLVAWNQVSALQGDSLASGRVRLTLHLLTGQPIPLPEMDLEQVDAIFEAFQKFQQNRQPIKIRIRTSLASESGEENEGASFSTPIAPPAQLEQFARNLCHNPEMKDLPKLPKEMLMRIAHTARLMFSGEEGNQLPHPQMGCHCMFCQIARAIHGGLEQSNEPVSQEELRLCEWHVRILEDSHYLVVSASDPSQCHEVHLKPAISCSCGRATCDHVDAVLRS